MVPLDGARAKLDRARTHIDDLRRSIGASESGLWSLPPARKFDADTSCIVYCVPTMPEVPGEFTWGLIIGDAVHSLRGALDHVWWQLALRHLRRQPTEQEARQIQFPVVYDSGKWPGRALDFVGPDAAPVRGLQPFAVAGENRKSPLEGLQRISNADKHRIIETVVVAAGAAHFISPGPDDFVDCEPRGNRPELFLTDPPRPLLAGSEVARVPVLSTGPSPDVELKGLLVCCVVVRENWNVIEMLDECVAMIDAVIRKFEPLFAAPSE